MAKKRSNETATDITDEDILKEKRVQPLMAAKYLGMTYPMLTYQLQEGMLPFGRAIKGKVWTYYIDPEKLVAYKHGGDVLQIISKKMDEAQETLDYLRALFEEYCAEKVS